MARHEPLADFVPRPLASKLSDSFYEDAHPEPPVCDGCGKRIEGEVGGRGLFVWTRGDEVRYEEPPLCAECAATVGLVAMSAWELEEEGD